jgi:hypothetical protein
LPDWATEVGVLTEGAVVELLDAAGVARELDGWDHFR